MSFHYLPELVGACSGPPFSDSGRSVPWRKSRTVEKCSYNANGTVCFPCSQSGTISKHSMENRGEELLALFRVGSLVSRSQLPASGKAPTTKEISGRKPSGSSEKSDLNTLSLKMSLDLFDPVILDKSCTTLWTRGTMRNGVCSERMQSKELLTAESDSGYWPTLLKSDSQGGHGTAKTRQGGPNFRNIYFKTFGESRIDPEWAEKFMGFPEGWTELQPWAMPKFQAWCAAHGKYLPDPPETQGDNR